MTEELRPLFEVAGYKVYFYHLHNGLPPIFAPVPGKMNYRRQIMPAAKGSTVCRVVSENVGITKISRCSLTDQFNKSTGRKMALRKVLSESFVRPQRAVFWFHYFQATGEYEKALQVNIKWHVSEQSDVL